MGEGWKIRVKRTNIRFEVTAIKRYFEFLRQFNSDKAPATETEEETILEAYVAWRESNNSAKRSHEG